MSLTYVIHDVILDDEDRLLEVIQSVGTGNKVVVLRESELSPALALVNEPSAIFFVSIECACLLRRNSVKGFLKFFDLKPSLYLPSMYDRCFCGVRSVFKPASMIRWTGEPFFLKPDSGLKIFTGVTIRSEIDLRSALSRCQADSMCLVAPAVEIIKEWRFWVVDDQIVGGSRYFWDTANRRYDEPIPQDVLRFAEGIVSADWQPDDCYTFDVGLSDGGEVRLVEYNCLSVSGLYGVDTQPLFSSIERKLSRNNLTSV